MIRPTLLTAGLAILLAPGLFSQSFSTQDFRGTYAFSFKGSLIRTTTGVPLPVTALGVFTLDGQGKVTKAVRILNAGGQVIRQTSTGTFTVNPDGTGTATFIVLPAEGEPPVFPPTREVFHFVFSNARNGRGMGASIVAANGQDIGFVPVIRAEFVRQDIP